MNTKTQLYKIARQISTSENKYTYIGSRCGFTNYRVISSGELSIRGKDINLPRYVREFVRNQGEALLICNMVRGICTGIIFRGLKEKAFINYGFGKGQFYGIGFLDKDFKYGDLIVLVEGAIDRDICSMYLTKNCLSVLTSTITNNQLQILSHLTNKVLLLLDNDEAGIRGEKNTKRKLINNGITAYQIDKSDKIKDLGDLLELKMEKNEIADFIINNYRVQILSHGGKLV